MVTVATEENGYRPTLRVPPGKDDVLDIEIDSYIHCISAFVKLAQSEYALLTEIIPEHHQKKTFDSLIQGALDNLMLGEGDDIVSAARRAIMRHDYSAVLTIFPILRHLKQTKADFDSVLQVQARPGPPPRFCVGTRPRSHVVQRDRSISVIERYVPETYPCSS
ncbi:hypothetical protein JZ751_016677 [Albula glossodonta]|uniref:Uncharacterized protein n=1 Tax=Albula glossodonta TaxID=121402 RepID=A0A8T2MV22_9TELE|nr:hypothetical protein JZ751_016677 [Albula glossodonta]